MGLTGQLAYFRESPVSDPEEIIRKLIDRVEIDWIGSASRFPDRSLQSLREVRGEIAVEHFDPHYGRSRLKRPSVEDATAFFRDGENFGIYAWEAKVQIEFNKVVMAIDPSIRGDWVIDTTFIEIGPHELFEAASTLNYFGHAEVSVRFSGNGSPLDWSACRRMVLELPEVRAFAKRLEPILGEVKTCVYWDG